MVIKTERQNFFKSLKRKRLKVKKHCNKLTMLIGRLYMAKKRISEL